jgi:hypothetical protein
MAWGFPDIRPGAGSSAGDCPSCYLPVHDFIVTMKRADRRARSWGSRMPLRSDQGARGPGRVRSSGTLRAALFGVLAISHSRRLIGPRTHFSPYVDRSRWQT